MSRLTLRLPETLHRQLEKLASHEAVSLNQYIVYALTRQATAAYTVQSVSDDTRDQDQASYTTLVQSLGKATTSELERALKKRARVKPEKGLTPERVKIMRKRIANAR